MSGFSKVYDWDGVVIDLSRIVVITSVKKEPINGKYQYKLTIYCGKDWTWFSNHDNEYDANMSRGRLISAWKRYCDKIDEEVEPKPKVIEPQVEDIPVDPIASLEPK